MEIKGEVTEIIYKNEVNGYCIAVFETAEESTTIVGYLPFVNKNDTLEVIGKFVEHQEYGRQFKVETFKKVMPETLDSLERYLANGLIKGIGPATAKKIVDTFGKETINVFKLEPERLSQIKGISKDKALEIAQEFVENWELWQLVSYLEKFGLGPQSAQGIYKKLGENAIEKIEADPYVLVELSNKVDFVQIDKMALKIGMEYDNEKRIRSGIKYALLRVTYNGNCAVLYENLVDFARELLGVSEDAIDSSLINMKAKEEIYIEERGNEDWIYLSTYYKAEKNIAEKLIELREYKNINAVENLDRKLKKIEKTQKIELSDKQKEAVKLVNDNNVCVITGGPGTGKTTIIKSIIDIYKEEELKITLCAPTGRAAKRMTEATGEEAKTLHRVLEIGKFASEDEINPDLLVTPIDANVVIIDEASMIDLFLMNYLMKALYSGTKLILVGDENQLPSVGPGNVLKDIIASEKVPVVTLNKIFRQAAKSKIILNSHKVNEGESFIGIKQENEEELLQDFFFIQENNKENIIKQIVSLCTGRLERYGNYDFIKNIQVITPTKKGNLGTKELNQVIQSNVNPFETTKKEKKFGDTIFRQGDRIMQIKNNYDIFWERDGKTNEAGSGVFNGEFGTIIDINEMDKEIVIKFDDDKKAWYSYADLDQIEHAYAITVHKAQRK
ncbi:helicase RecD/TraA family [Clostridium sp. CAG:273]|nr:ATP-dependent RecD-like DNA helicase [Clostridia bacterium]CDE83425.1 helicase RecD/TraA family [Clostridium sp. CAG:273]